VKYLKFFIQFKENATASASSTAGAGAVSSAQPGALPGTTGTEGSGDIGFTFKKEKRKKGDSVDLDDEETGYFSQEELRISLNKNINEYWTGNMIVNCKFDESGVISKDISTLRARGKELTESESELYVLVEEVAQKLLGNLDYEKGSFRISFEVAGSAMPYNTTRNTSVNVHFNLENNLKE